MSLAEWLERLRAALPPGTDVGTGLSPEEERLILELARVAAHTSERIAAPLTTFIAGVALAGLAPEERAEHLREILASLDD